MLPSLIKDDTFSFYVPAEICKSEDTTDKDDKRWVQGIASTENVDLQGETVIQHGIDTSYFLKYGYFNSDHSPGPENKVGEPTECRATKAGLWVKGFLYKGNEKADHWWDLMKSLEESGAKRKVAWSIQGKVIRRGGNSILKCWLQDIAITASPVNTHTWAEIVKSLTSERWCIHPWKSLEKACKGCPGNKDCETSIPAMLKQKEDEEKALSTGGMGRNLIPQSLEGSAKIQTYKSNDFYTKEEAIKFLQLSKGYSDAAAKVVADAIFMAHAQ